MVVFEASAPDRCLQLRFGTDVDDGAGRRRECRRGAGRARVQLRSGGHQGKQCEADDDTNPGNHGCRSSSRSRQGVCPRWGRTHRRRR